MSYAYAGYTYDMYLYIFLGGRHRRSYLFRSRVFSRALVGEARRAPACTLPGTAQA